MNAQQPTQYSDTVGGDEEKRANTRSLRWSQTQMLLVLAAVVIVIADLALTVKTHGLYQEAVSSAGKASSDATQALGYTIDLGDVNDRIDGLNSKMASAQADIQSLQAALANLTSSVIRLPSFTSELQSNVTKLQKQLANTTSDVDQLSKRTLGLKTNMASLQDGLTTLRTRVDGLDDDGSSYVLSKGIKARGVSSANAMTAGWMSLGGLFALML